MTKKSCLAAAMLLFGLCLGMMLAAESALATPRQQQSSSKRRRKSAPPAKKNNESAKQAQPAETTKKNNTGGSGFSKFQCVTWEVTVRTNPLFPNADTVDWRVTGNVLDSGDGQCQVKIKSQEKTTFFLSSRPPYRSDDTIIIECSKLEKCAAGN